MSFDGFISYSHAADGRVAPAVQRGLQSLAKPWHRRRALWIFRDQTGLAVTPALWSSIKQALDSSEYFVLMASPDAAKSPWVNKEIEHWVATKSPDKILPVVTDGEWRWDAERGDFADDSTAVPAALRRVFTEEPLYLDLRWARDEGQLSLRHSRFRDGIAQLAAPMHGISKDDLEGEDVRQHRRARRLWSVAVTSLTLLTLVASLTGVLAMRNADRANASAAEALRQQLRASEQEDNAGRSAHEANRQLENARNQEARAKEAMQETRRQEQRAQRQRELADRASADAARQQANARRQQANARQQQQAAERAGKRAREQEALAQRQSDLAKKSAEETRRQKKLAEVSRRQKEIAEEQTRLAQEARAEAEREKQTAELQKRLADEAAAEARQQQERAREQQRLAEEAAEEARKLAEQAAEDARKEKANAEQQQRIAIGRRVNNQARAIAADETGTALMLGVAAAKVQADDEARRQLAGLVTSTHYAGSLDEVRDVGYVSDDVLLTQAPDYQLKLWNVANRAAPALLADLGTYPYWAVSPDRRTVAAYSVGEPSVVLLDVTEPSDPDQIAEIPVSSRVFNVTFSQDSRTLFVGAWDEAAKDVGDLWNVSDPRRPEPLATRFDGAGLGLALGKFVQEASFSPDGNTLVTLHDDDSTGVWDLTKPTQATLRATLKEPLGRERMHTLAFLRDVPILVVGCDTTTLLIDLSTPAAPKRHTTMANNGDIVTSVVVSSDGERLVVSDQDGLVELIEVGKGTLSLRSVATIRDLEGMQATALSPDGRTVVTADWNATATQWNTTVHGAPQAAVDFVDPGEQGLAAAFTPDGRSLLTVGSNPRAAVWNVSDPVRPVRVAAATVHGGKIAVAAVTLDGRTLATADAKGQVRVSDMTDPAEPVTIAEFVDKEALSGWNDQLVISPDGRTLALGNAYDPVVLWDVTRGRAAKRLGPLAASRMPVAFSPKDRTVAVADTKRSAASMWTLDGPAGPARLGPLGDLGRSSIEAIAFHPGGRTVAMAGSTAAAVWNVGAQGPPRQSGKFANPGPTSSIIFSTDGQSVATLSGYRTTLWDFGDRADPVPVATMTLWKQMARGARITATFNADGRSLVTAAAPANGFGGTATLWDLRKLQEVRADPTVPACAMAGRGLSEDEWVRYIPELPYQSTCPG